MGVPIGRYNVIEMIGQGGMGKVWRAEDPMLERTVALKTITPARTADPARQAAARERFYREARAVARLDSPYIVKIFDIGEHREADGSNINYIVMEFVSGRTLTTLIEGLTVPAKDVLAWRMQLFWQVLQGMAYAHENGVVHRDLKPDNVMLTKDGKIKIMDFGLALLDDSHSQTRDDQIMGTLAYFAPEQALGGKAVDHRADIYALGVILFELATGRLPFEASNPLEMITKVREAPPPNPSDYNTEAPWGLDKLVLRALRKNPNDRYQTVGEMKMELELFMQEQMSADTRKLDPHSAPRFDKKPPEPQAKQSAPGWQSELMKASGLFPQAEPAAGVGYRPVSPPPSSPAIPPMSPKAPMPKVTVPPIVIPPAVLNFQPPPPTTFAPITIPDIKVPPKAPEPPPPPPPPPQAAPHSRPSLEEAIQPNQPYTPFFQGRGAPGVASRGWMNEAGPGSVVEPVDVQEKNREKIRRDAEAQARLADPNAPRLLCAACGAENPGGFTNCIECEEPLKETRRQSYFRVQTEARDRYMAASQALSQGRFEEALKDAQVAVDTDPELGEAHLVLGRAFLGLQRLDEAAASLQRAADLLTTAPEPYLVLAEVCLAKDDIDGVIACLLEALDRNPSDCDTRSRLAFLYSENGHVNEAVEHYRQVLRTDKRNLTANRQLGLLLAASDRNDEAIRYLEFVSSELDREDAQSATLLGRLYARKRQFDLAQNAFQTAINLKDDRDPGLRAELGALFQAQNREDLAQAELQRALELDPGNREARLRLAGMWERHGRVDKALPLLEEALRYHPKDLVVHRRLGELYLQKPDLARAMLHFEQVVQLDPSCAEMHNKLGRIYLKKNYTDKSIEAYKQAVDLHKVEPEYREDLAMAFYCAGDFPMAINELRKAATLDGQNPDYFKALGMLFYAENQDEESVRHLQWSLKLAPADAQAHGMLGQALARQGLTNMAISEYQKALEIDPQLHLLHLYLARAYAQANRHSDAINCFKNFANRLSTLEESQFLGQAYVEMGRSYLEEGQTARAGEVFQAALQRNPRDAGAMLGLARVATARGDFKKARERLKEAMRLEPRNLELLKAMADLQGEEGNWNDAVLTLQKALTENAGDPDLHEALGRALRKGGRHNEAASTYRRGAEIFSARQGRFYWLEGRVEARRERWGEAAMLFRRALERMGQNWQVYEDLAQACYKLGEYDQAKLNLQRAIEQAPDKEQASLRRLVTLYSAAEEAGSR